MYDLIFLFSFEAIYHYLKVYKVITYHHKIQRGFQNVQKICQLSEVKLIHVVENINF